MTIFSYRDIPVRIHWTFFLLFVFLVAPYLWPLSLSPLISASVLLVGLFSFVIMHEFGHALMAQRFGMKTRSITLYPFGGIAAVENMVEGGKAELYIALAGPAVNAVMCILLLPLMLMGVPFCFEFFWLNLIMAVFNMFPVFPMDGGRVLRALLTKWTTKEEATKQSLRISVVFVSLFFIGAIKFVSLSLFLVAIALSYFIYNERRRMIEEERRRLKWEMFREK